MQITAELLMAYADGELDAAAAAAVEAAMRDDAGLAAQVAEHRALRARLQAAFAGDLLEPVPGRLLEAARRTPAAGVSPAGAAARAHRRWWRSPLPLAAAASLVLGVGIGLVVWHASGRLLHRTAHGTPVASGRLAHALSHDLSGPGGTGGVDVILSFVDRSGEYCRAFRIAGRVPRSGVACRGAAQWRIAALARAPGEPGRESGYRTAGSSLPPAVLQAIQSRIVGQPLDRAGERAARARDWAPRHADL